MAKATSQLPAAAALTGAELAKVVQGGNDVQTTLAAILALAGGTPVIPEFTEAAAPNGPIYRLLRFGPNSFWFYVTDDSSLTVDTTGYFEGFGDHMAKGDVVFALANMADIEQHGLFVVASVDAGVVDLANMVVFGSINTD